MKTKIIKNFSINLIVILIVLMTPIFVYLNNFERYAFNLQFYEEKFEEHNISKEVNNSLTITKELLIYLKNNEDVKIETDVFNEKEKQHLLEVKTLIASALKTKNFSIFVLILLFVLLFLLCKNNSIFLRKLSIGIFVGALLVVFLFLFGTVLLSNFTESFFTFHRTFFESTTWMLNPEIDMLIRLFPENFFYDITEKIFMSSLMHSAFILILSSFILFWYFPKARKKGVKKQKK